MHLASKFDFIKSYQTSLDLSYLEKYSQDVQARTLPRVLNILTDVI